jgi:hypothetical protein
MTQAQAAFAPWAVAAGHRAGGPAEHRVARVEDQVIGAELRAHRGHEFLQQASRHFWPPQGTAC